MKIIEDYNKLSQKQIVNLNQYALIIFNDIIKCYIRHITDYNFKLENKEDIISEICNNL